MKTRTILLTIGIPLVAITGVILFRHYIPYAMRLTELLGIEKSAPTAEALSYLIQTDPIGAVRTGGVVATVVGVFKVVLGKLKSFLGGIRDTATGVSSVKNQLAGGFNEVVVDIESMKTDLSGQISGITSEFTSLKTDFAGQMADVKSIVQTSAGDIQVLKEDGVQVTATMQNNTAEILSLKELVQQQKDYFDSQVNSLLEKIKDPLHSYQ